MYVPHWTNSTGESMRLLRATGVDVRVVAANERRHPIEWINDELRTLPVGSWMMTPDADEFYHFPCAESRSMSMASLVARGFDQFCGFMEDMTTESGRLELIDEACALDRARTETSPAPRAGSQLSPLVSASDHGACSVTSRRTSLDAAECAPSSR